MVERSDHRRGHRPGSRGDPRATASGGRRVDVDADGAERLGVGGVDRRAFRIVGHGAADIDEVVEQLTVGPGFVEAAIDVAAQTRRLGAVAGIRLSAAHGVAGFLPGHDIEG